ncbi:phospholipase domain-containing protein [Streptomyces cavernicola]|uniref:DUF756 domain-containing protein n=1 Tax=Streptomyces cavernicola TaxID=3043613 RepID=A0ABT6SJU1_9ACTN|nr:phospholipase domain-containing protein [Streptomyces sp. B-S-A6]MDI3408468.1 DUF756 domain-containing protein [Streptomyces sp. B-S-A6]
MADEHWQGQPTGLGIRVPMLVVSPWTVGGHVTSEVFDHTSVIRFLEQWTGIEEPNISAWRRQVTGDLTGAFDFTRGRPQPEVEQPGPVPPFTGRWRPEPPQDQKMPEQEPGRRPARPLPYQPDAHGRVSRDGKQVELTLTNSGRSSAHFALYPYAAEYEVPQHLDVRGSAPLRVPLTEGAYRFTVTGPNGFRREFAGRADGSAAVTTKIDASARIVSLTLGNTGGADLTFTLRPLAYTDAAPRTVRVRPGASRTVAYGTDEAHGWYDLEVVAAGDEPFRRRLMGHIENGRDSVSG